MSTAGYVCLVAQLVAWVAFAGCLVLTIRTRRLNAETRRMIRDQQEALRRFRVESQEGGGIGPR